MKAETAAAAVRQRQEDAEKAWTKAVAAQKADAAAAERAGLNNKAEAAAAKANLASGTAVGAAETAGLEPPELEPLAARADSKFSHELALAGASPLLAAR